MGNKSDKGKMFVARPQYVQPPLPEAPGPRPWHCLAPVEVFEGHIAVLRIEWTWQLALPGSHCLVRSCRRNQKAGSATPRSRVLSIVSLCMLTGLAAKLPTFFQGTYYSQKESILELSGARSSNKSERARASNQEESRSLSKTSCLVQGPCILHWEVFILSFEPELHMHRKESLHG